MNEPTPPTDHLTIVRDLYRKNQQITAEEIAETLGVNKTVAKAHLGAARRAEMDLQAKFAEEEDAAQEVKFAPPRIFVRDPRSKHSYEMKIVSEKPRMVILEPVDENVEIKKV